MNLTNYKLAEVCEPGHKFNLLEPGTNAPADVFITVRGAESKTVKAWTRNEFMKRQQKQATSRRNQEQPVTLPEAEEFAAQSAAVRVVTFEGMEENGVKIEPTEANILRIMREYEWIRDQVMEESGFLLNFTSKPSTELSSTQKAS